MSKIYHQLINQATAEQISRTYVGNYPHVVISKTPFKLERVPENDDRGNIDEVWGEDDD